MSFLDNLESSLKNLETREERDPQEAARRDRDRADAVAIAPWAERLKSSSFVAKLLNESALFGHRLRSKIYAAWIDGALRLEVRAHVCELIPTSDGIEYRYQKLSDGSTSTGKVDLDSNPQDLLTQWLG